MPAEKSVTRLLEEVSRMRGVIRDLLNVRQEQHRKKYSPGFEQRVNAAWDAAEREVQ